MDLDDFKILSAGHSTDNIPLTVGNLWIFNLSIYSLLPLAIHGELKLNSRRFFQWFYSFNLYLPYFEQVNDVLFLLLNSCVCVCFDILAEKVTKKKWTNFAWFRYAKIVWRVSNKLPMSCKLFVWPHPSFFQFSLVQCTFTWISPSPSLIVHWLWIIYNLFVCCILHSFVVLLGNFHFDFFNFYCSWFHMSIFANID